MRKETKKMEKRKKKGTIERKRKSERKKERCRNAIHKGENQERREMN